jgi:hypothetical protein
MDRTGLEVFTGDSAPDKPFNRAAARNAAADAAGDWDVACFLDADVYLPELQLYTAITKAVEHDGAALPFTRFVSMNPVTLETRDRVMTGGANFLIAGCVVVTRSAFEEVGGWDESIAGYGWEDGAFLKMMIGLRHLSLVEGTMVAYEHARSMDEEPEAVLERGKPPEVLRYDEQPLADIAADLRAQRALRACYTADSSPEKQGESGETRWQVPS